MDVDQRVELLRLGPERLQRAIAQLHRSRRSRARRPEPQLAPAALELGDRERRHVQRQRAEPDEARRISGDGLGDPVACGAREPQARLRVGPFEALMHQACAQHLDVDPHRIHLGDALAEVAHPAKHGLRPVLDLTAHLVGDAGIGRKLGEDVVLGRLRVDFGHDDVGVDIDARVRLLDEFISGP